MEVFSDRAVKKRQKHVKHVNVSSSFQYIELLNCIFLEFDRIIYFSPYISDLLDINRMLSC